MAQSKKFTYSNVVGEVKDDKLILEIDLTADLGFSRSGKSKNIATTSGNKVIPDSDGAVIGLNVYRPV